VEKPEGKSLDDDVVPLQVLLGSPSIVFVGMFASVLIYWWPHTVAPTALDLTWSFTVAGVASGTVGAIVFAGLLLARKPRRHHIQTALLIALPAICCLAIAPALACQYRATTARTTWKRLGPSGSNSAVTIETFYQKWTPFSEAAMFVVRGSSAEIAKLVEKSDRVSFEVVEDADVRRLDEGELEEWRQYVPLQDFPTCLDGSTPFVTRVLFLNSDKTRACYLVRKN
jgi:hypothetical protein